MIPKEFKNTKQLKEEYNNHMAQFEYQEIPEEFAHLPPIEIQQKEFEQSQEYKMQVLIEKTFSKEYKKLTDDLTYFLGCPYSIYASTYETRLKSFKDNYMDAEEHNFIIDELNLISSYQFPEFIETGLKKSIKYSLEKTNNYLKEKLQSLGYKIENTITKEGKINSIAVKNASVIKLDTEPIIDLSDSKAKDKIRFLGLIGFFDFIKEKEPYLNINQIASLLSAITSIKQQTIQPYINPILSKEVSQNNNPFNDKPKVNIARKQLINIGLTNIKTF
ncbi:hypothetical protein [Confluentibacter sediminis]|uniref:hypothetical protein n=1 Tax=Confluentibacter sediminis TaxID=2219045 RepID=UPI000DAB7AE3|nr:hypothetical protein [Confluentibacter sediminis]